MASSLTSNLMILIQDRLAIAFYDAYSGECYYLIQVNIAHNMMNIFEGFLSFDYAF